MILQVCDLGGTHCRIGRYVDGRLDVASVARYENRDYSSFPAVMAHYQATAGLAPAQSMVIALAAPVTGDVIALTNLDWTIDRDEISRATGVRRVFLINDFEALGHALSSPQSLELRSLNEANGDRTGTRLILGAGTGFNCAARLSNGSVVCCEAGHSTFVAETDFDRALQHRFSQRHGRCSFDRVLSGSGLGEIYQTLCERQGEAPRHTSSLQIVPAAIGGHDALATRACEEFARILGRAAGDLALLFLATGGVYITGGAARALEPFIIGPKSGFTPGFTSKGRMAGFMETIPVALVLDDNAALFGCHEWQKRR
ncbi:MAG: glucokinase [Hoeflea sp.]|uniref:glucokinase n=1 Tax=Hoeflea sp. TaxID=1940281 RepID=UPI003EF4C4E7